MTELENEPKGVTNKRIKEERSEETTDSDNIRPCLRFWRRIKKRFVRRTARIVPIQIVVAARAVRDETIRIYDYFN